MDFVMDRLTNDRKLKCLTIADDFNHESIDIAVDHGIRAGYVTRIFEQAARFRGYPHAIRTDGGPEFTSRAFLTGMQARCVKHLLIVPGEPTQNAYVKSFNGKFRDERLNEHWFESLVQARAIITRWRRDYNKARPHSSWRRIPPAQYATQHRQTAEPSAKQEEII